MLLHRLLGRRGIRRPDSSQDILVRPEIPLASPCRFDPIGGSEIGKTSPALVLQNDIGNRHADTTIVATIPARVKELPTLVDVEPNQENGL